MKGKGLRRVFAIASTVTTLVLLGGIGASAASGHLGSAKAGKDITSLIAQPVNAVVNSSKDSRADEGGGGDGNHRAKCKGDSDEHRNGTPGHENGCDNESAEGDGGDDGGGGGPGD